MTEKIRNVLEGREMFVFSITTALLLFTAAFLLAPPEELLRGMVTIVLTRDALVTDYFELAGFGAAFLNAGLVMGLAILLIRLQKIPFTGLTMAVLFINAGFALFGKNPVNILPMLFGTWLYARFHRTGMNRYIYTALFGSCLAPMVTELVYLLPFSFPVNLGIAILTGIFSGFVLPPLSVQELREQTAQALENLKHFQSRECAEKVEKLLLHELPKDVSERLLQIREQLKLYEDDNAEELLGQLLDILEKEEERK